MAVETTNAHSGPYTANGATTAFPFTFSAMSGDDVAVISRSAAGVDTTVSSSAYSVALTGTAPSAGTVTFTTAPASGVQIILLLDPGFTQETEFENGSPWLASPVNNANDRSALRDQALKRDVDRAFKVPVGEDGLALPSAAARAGKFIAFDAEGALVPASGSGADGALRTDIAQPNGSGLSGFSQTPTYGAGTSGKKLQQVVTITDAPFNAVSGADCTSAIAAAIAVVQARGGGIVRIPEGDFRYTAISIPSGNPVIIEGAGFCSSLTQTTATGVGVTVTANDSGVRGCRLTASVTRTNLDPFILLAGGNTFACDNSFDADKCGIKMTGVGADAYQNTFANAVAAARRIWATGGDKSQSVHDNLMHYQAPGVECGVFTDDSSALKVYNNDIVGQGEGLKIAPGSGQTVVSLRSYNNFYDTSVSGMLVAPSGSGNVVRCSSSGDWFSSHSTNGVLIDTTASASNGVDGFDIYQPEAHLNTVNGIAMVGTRTINVRIHNPRSRGNTLAAVSAGAGVGKFSVVGLQAQAADGLSVNGYGVFLGGSNDNYEIRNSDVTGQTTAGISGHTGWSATKRVYDNRGYVTENSGASAIPNGTTSIVVSHGLGETPRAQDIQITATNPPTVIGNVLYVDTTTISPTQFTVKCGANAVGTLDFTWKAIVGDR